MRDVDGGDAEARLDAADLLAQLHAHLGVERRERLVEEEQPRLDREGAGERDALLHAARQLVRVTVGGISEADELEQLECPLPPVAVTLLADAQPELDVPDSRHVREEAVGLEDHADVALVGRYARDVLVVDQDPARGRPVEARDETESGRLAATGRPEEGDELAGADVEIDPCESDDLTEPPVQLLQLDIGHAYRAPSATGAVRPPLPTAARASIEAQVIPNASSVTAAAGYALFWLMYWT